MKKPKIGKELAEFVGILLGDGYIESKEKKHYEVKISLDKVKDKEYAKFVVILIHRLFDIETKSKERSDDGALDIRISKKEFVKYLTEEIGLKKSPKMGNAIIPKIFLKKKFYGSLIRGYFDTDGCIVDTNNNGTRYPRVEMKICKSPMQRQYIKLIKSLKIRFGVYNVNNGGIRIQVNGKNELRKWMNVIGSNNRRNLIKANRFLKN